MRTSSLSDTKESPVSVTAPSEKAHIAPVDFLLLHTFTKAWVICPCVKTAILVLISVTTQVVGCIKSAF